MRLKKYVKCIDAALVVVAAIPEHSLSHLRQHFKTPTCYKVGAWAAWQHTKCNISIKR